MRTDQAQTTPNGRATIPAIDTADLSQVTGGCGQCGGACRKSDKKSGR